VLVTVLAVIVGVFSFIVPQFVRQLGRLQEQLSQATEQLSNLLGQGVLSQANLRLGEVQQQIIQYAQGNLDQIMSGATLLLEVVAGLLLTMVFLFFLMKDRDEITAWFARHVPDQRRDEVTAAARGAWATLSGYFRGIVMIAAVDALGIGVGLLIIGVPLVLPLMVLVFAGAFFPVVGAFAAGLVAVLVAFVSGGLVDAALTLGVIVLVQQLEGNVLHPVIMRRSVPLHPVVVLLALTAGGVLAGIPGAFFAVPVAAVITAAGGELYATRGGESAADDAPRRAAARSPGVVTDGDGEPASP
jgi:predicted PurR-regulated permease PerM